MDRKLKSLKSQPKQILIVIFVGDKTMVIMNVIEKRDFIHSNLHETNEDFINEIYQKMLSSLKGGNPIVGYEASGNPIKKSQFIADIKEAEAQIERGEYLTIEELEKESEQW